MGIIVNYQIAAIVPVLLLALLQTASAANISRCERNVQYLDHNLQKCTDCSKCDQAINLVVIRPCEVHRDTLCGTLNQLLEGMHLRHHRNRQRKHPNKEEDNSNENNSVVRAGEQQHRDDFLEREREVVLPRIDRAPFNEAENLVWDWQAIALTCAVFTCILFFLVIAIYSMHQARQWRRLKQNFDSDVEELSARLSLMAANSNDRGETLEPCSGPIRDSHYLNNRCMYLEQLLQVRKEKKPGTESGNVYIQETSGKASA